MNGARFVHDELVAHGWEVLVADAQRVEGLAPLACKTDQVGMDRGPPTSDEMLVAGSRRSPDNLTRLTRRARSPCR
jgi:hypothetical protein